MPRRSWFVACLLVVAAVIAPGSFPGARAAVLPDLVVSAVAAPTSVVAGTSITVGTTVKNLQGRAGSSYVRVVLSRDKVVGSTDKVLGKRFVPGLAAGAVSKGSRTWTIPATTAAGAWYLVACADATRLVREAREGNNCRARAITVARPNRAPVAGPDSFEILEDGELVVMAEELLANDTDPDGDPLEVTAAGPATNGSVELLGGTITFTPTPEFQGTAGFSYTLSDGKAVVQGSVTVEVLMVSPQFQVDQEPAVAEGDYAIAWVRLTDKPDADVTVTVTPVGDNVWPTVGSLTFTPANWSTPQQLTVAALHDVDTVNGVGVVWLEAPGLTTAQLGWNIIDDDTQAIDVSATTLTVTEGSSNTVGVRLAYQPAGNVTVAVASGNTSAATVAPASLTFTPSNWNTFQNVTVSGVQDINLAHESTTVQVTSAGLTPRSISVVVVDDETQAVHASASSKSIREGTQSTVEITLGFQPQSNTTVSCTSSPGGSVGVSPATMTFTPANYALPQALNLTGLVDGDQIDDEATVTCSATNATSAVIAVTVVEIV